MFYKCKKCEKEVIGKEISGVISDDESVALTHIKCGGDIERSNYTKHLPNESGYYWQRDKSHVRLVEVDIENDTVYLFGLDDTLSLKGCTDWEWSEKILHPE